MPTQDKTSKEYEDRLLALALELHELKSPRYAKITVALCSSLTTLLPELLPTARFEMAKDLARSLTPEMFGSVGQPR